MAWGQRPWRHGRTKIGLGGLGLDSCHWHWGSPGPKAGPLFRHQFSETPSFCLKFHLYIFPFQSTHTTAGPAGFKTQTEVFWERMVKRSNLSVAALNSGRRLTTHHVNHVELFLKITTLCRLKHCKAEMLYPSHESRPRWCLKRQFSISCINIVYWCILQILVTKCYKICMQYSTIMYNMCQSSFCLAMLQLVHTSSYGSYGLGGVGSALGIAAMWQTAVPWEIPLLKKFGCMICHNLT